MGHQKIWHGEEGRIHDSCSPTKNYHTSFSSGQCHKRHSCTIKQKTTNIDIFRSERKVLKEFNSFVVFENHRKLTKGASLNDLAG